MGRNRNFEFANFGELIEEDEMWNPFVEEVVATALAYDGDHRFRIRLFIKDETETRFEPVGDVYFRNSHFRGEKPVSNIESVVKQCRKKLQDNPGEDWPVDGMKGTFRMRASNTTTTDPLKTLTGYIKGQKGMAERELDLRLAAYDHIFMRVQQMGDAMPEMLRSLSERDKAITEMVKGTATAQKEVVSMAVDLIRGESAIDVTPEEDDEPDGTVVSILKSVMGLVVSDEQSRKMLGAGADAAQKLLEAPGKKVIVTDDNGDFKTVTEEEAIEEGKQVVIDYEAIDSIALLAEMEKRVRDKVIVEVEGSEVEFEALVKSRIMALAQEGVINLF